MARTLPAAAALTIPAVDRIQVAIIPVAAVMVIRRNSDAR